MIFYSFDSFNIWTYDLSGIKNKEGGLYFLFGGIDSPKKQKKKKTTLVVKRSSMIILEVKESELCIQNLS